MLGNNNMKSAVLSLLRNNNGHGDDEDAAQAMNKKCQGMVDMDGDKQQLQNVLRVSLVSSYCHFSASLPSADSSAMVLSVGT